MDTSYLLYWADGIHTTTDFKQPEINSCLQTLAMTIQAKAESYQGESLELLALLRLLENLHQDIRDSLFLESLPNDHQALYTLLENIQEEGGWPCIQPMKLRSLLATLTETPSTELEPKNSTESSVEYEIKPQYSLKQGEAA